LVLFLVVVVVVVLVLVLVVVFRILAVSSSIFHLFLRKSTVASQTLADGSENTVFCSEVRERGQVQGRLKY
jgi:uncharacterized protein HemY